MVKALLPLGLGEVGGTKVCVLPAALSPLSSFGPLAFGGTVVAMALWSLPGFAVGLEFL